MHDCKHCSNNLWDSAYEMFFHDVNLECLINRDVKVHISIEADNVSLWHLQEMKCMQTAATSLKWAMQSFDILPTGGKNNAIVHWHTHTCI